MMLKCLVCVISSLQSKLPYFVINYSKGKDTTLVTSGKLILIHLILLIINFMKQRIKFKE